VDSEHIDTVHFFVLSLCFEVWHWVVFWGEGMGGGEGGAGLGGCVGEEKRVGRRGDKSVVNVMCRT